MLSISPARIKEIQDPCSRILNQLHKILFISQLPPSVHVSTERRLVERYKHALFSRRNHARGWSLKDELNKVLSGTDVMIDTAIHVPELGSSASADAGAGEEDGPRHHRLTYAELQRCIERVLGETGYYEPLQRRHDSGRSSPGVVEHSSESPPQVSREPSGSYRDASREASEAPGLISALGSLAQASGSPLAFSRPVAANVAHSSLVQRSASPSASPQVSPPTPPQVSLLPAPAQVPLATGPPIALPPSRGGTSSLANASTPELLRPPVSMALEGRATGRPREGAKHLKSLPSIQRPPSIHVPRGAS
mmetsp:Transcript_5132/g.16916  ORF Transcript_5132/g.16916 Transcript_5132/m.16916 type:complete len:308 (+) Transcript_5132:2242-3165(+)